MLAIKKKELTSTATDVGLSVAIETLLQQKEKFRGDQTHHVFGDLLIKNFYRLKIQRRAHRLLLIKVLLIECFFVSTAWISGAFRIEMRKKSRVARATVRLDGEAKHFSSWSFNGSLIQLFR